MLANYERRVQIMLLLGVIILTGTESHALTFKSHSMLPWRIQSFQQIPLNKSCRKLSSPQRQANSSPGLPSNGLAAEDAGQEGRPRLRLSWVRRVARSRKFSILMSVVMAACFLLASRPALASSTLPAVSMVEGMNMAPDAATSMGSIANAAVPSGQMVLPSLEQLSSYRPLPTKAELVLSFRLAYAALGGSLVGLERSTSDRPAGVRTMALVSLGAAAFTLCSMFGFLAVANMSPAVKFDPSRMAANVASGVGFIGAGVITNNRKANGVYDRESSVKGLTTAAAIWVAAAVGVSSGVGLYYISAFASLGTICILRFGRVKHMGETFGQNVLSVGSKKQKRKSSSAIANPPVELSAVGASTGTTMTVTEPSDTAMISSSEHLVELGKTSPVNNNPREIGVTDELLYQEFEAGESMASAEAAVAAGFPKQSSSKPPTKTSTSKASSSTEGKSAVAAVSQKRASTKSSSSKASNKTSVDGKPPSSSKTMKDPLLGKYLWELEHNEELSLIPDVQLEEDILVPRPLGGESRP
eukprot:scaffold60077_cov58-Attheya_sp.AAC.3